MTTATHTTAHAPGHLARLLARALAGTDARYAAVHATTAHRARSLATTRCVLAPAASLGTLAANALSWVGATTATAAVAGLATAAVVSTLVALVHGLPTVAEVRTAASR